MAALPMEIREQRPSYVVFERKQVEDRDASLREGRYIARDEDYAIITPIGSKDRIPREVKSWFAALEQQAREERIPRAWVDQYRQAYEAWRRGEEIPLNGTPIKGWAVLSPAQQANVLSANVRTVEDLAQANDEARKRIGMGANELVDKAIAWLKSAQTQGPLVQENAALKARIRQLEAQTVAQEALIKDLRVENETLTKQADGKVAV
jgi:hypothetical protein